TAPPPIGGGSPHDWVPCGRTEKGMPGSNHNVAHLFAALGVAVEVTAKSAAFAFVSRPSGMRAMLAPGDSVAGGADAGELSTNAFVAVPQPTLSTSAPDESRTAM